MSFYGRSFTYNGIDSEKFNLHIGELDANAVNAMMGSSSMEISEQGIYRRPIPYFYGATPRPKLTFPMSAYSETVMDATMIAQVQKAFFSSRSYKHLQINQPDLEDIYFHCMLLDPQIVKVGNEGTVISFTVTNSSPYAWYYPKIKRYTFEDTPPISTSILFYNLSDDTDEYLYPILTVQMNSTGGDVTMYNVSDGNRNSEFTGLAANEQILMDCSKQTLESSTSLRRLGNFNKKFFRLVNGVNQISIFGNISWLDISTQFVSKKI